MYDKLLYYKLYAVAKEKADSNESAFFYISAFSLLSMVPFFASSV